MGTRLIFTVGTNPLPIWVAWHHLKDELQPVQVRFVHTAGTKKEKERLKKYCHGADFLNPIETSEGNPRLVRDAIKPVVNNLADTQLLHVHYTGGTKVMGVETVAAIEASLPKDIQLDTSYLDARAGSGPTIVNRAGKELVKDARKGICPDLKRIAELNGFEIGPFDHQYGSPGRLVTKKCPAPRIPTQEERKAGQIVLSALCRRLDEDFQDIFSRPADSCWNRTFSSNINFVYPQNGGTFQLPDNANPIWTNSLLPQLNNVFPHCQWDTTAGTLSYPAHGRACSEIEEELEQMHKFFNGTWFEYAAYASFQEALSNIATRNSIRTNHKLFHSVYARRAGAKNSKVKPFELDVVAVLGYQIVVVSCTTAFASQTVKQKAMEAYHRARQLGGDEARAVVLCANWKASEINLIQEELKDETGSSDLPLQIWGKRKWNELSSNFEQYLCNDLHWR